MSEFLGNVVAGPIGYVPAIVALVLLIARTVADEADTRNRWLHAGAYSTALVAVTAVAFALLGVRLLSVMG